MTPSLSILCVTRGEAHVWSFLEHLVGLSFRVQCEVVIAADGAGQSPEAHLRLSRITRSCWSGLMAPVISEGFIESVLDEAVEHCTGDYVLRIDDDERCSPAMVEWLKSGAWWREPSWAFATAGLWGDEQTVMVMPELWPQYHTRLSTKALSGGRKRIHSPSPHGRGAIAPVVLEHHKFLVKSLAERQAIAERYDRIRPGSGKRCHSTPELVYDEFWLAPLGDGTLRTWRADEVRRVQVAQAVMK